MDAITLCKRLEKVTYTIEVFWKDELIGSGSGVAFDERGLLLTAAHVVARLDHVEEDVKDPDTVIIARTSKGGYRRYGVGICAPSIHIGEQFVTKPLIIDLAVLIPFGEPKLVEYLPINDRLVEVGETVYLAGFPDEMELPLEFDKTINYRSLGLSPSAPQLAMLKRLLMIKRGMIGNTSMLALHTHNIGPLRGQVFYIDNAMHRGASGGPVIDETGELIGIITQRAITSVPYEETPRLRVPSGSAVAITPQLINPLIAQMIRR